MCFYLYDRVEQQCRRNKIPSRLRHALYEHAAQLLRRGKAGLLQHARRLNQRNTETRSNIEKYLFIFLINSGLFLIKLIDILKFSILD